MSEWWTYTLSDFLLFSARTYFRLFELYNRDVWPLHAVAVGAGLAVLALLLRQRPRSWHGRAVCAVLAAGWSWVAWAFHVERYAAIHWAAPWFGAAFAVEAALLFGLGVVAGRLRFDRTADRADRAGLALFLFALLGMPWMPVLAGRPWSQAEVFGLAPDPTALATLGVLLRAPARFAWVLLPIPLLWCAVAGATLWAMRVPYAAVPLGAAAAALALAAARAR